MDDTNQPWSQQRFSRRHAITVGAGAIATGLAGCTSSSGKGAESDDGASGDGETVVRFRLEKKAPIGMVTITLSDTEQQTSLPQEIASQILVILVEDF